MHTRSACCILFFNILLCLSIAFFEQFPIENGSSSPSPSAQEKPQTVDEQSEALDDPKSETLLKQKKVGGKLSTTFMVIDVH